MCSWQLNYIHGLKICSSGARGHSRAPTTSHGECRSLMAESSLLVLVLDASDEYVESLTSEQPSQKVTLDYTKLIYKQLISVCTVVVQSVLGSRDHLSQLLPAIETVQLCCSVSLPSSRKVICNTFNAKYKHYKVLYIAVGISANYYTNCNDTIVLILVM